MTPKPVSPAPQAAHTSAPATWPDAAAQGSLWLVRHASVLRPAGLWPPQADAGRASPVAAHPAAAGEAVTAYCYGRLDWPADPLATQELARSLASRLPSGARLRSSTRQRTRLLAQELLALRPDLQPGGADARLDELDFGAWEGRPWNDIGEAAVAAWVHDFADVRVGGGESVRQLLQRVQAALIEQAADGPGEVVWLCHAGVIRACLWLHGASPGAIPQADTWPCTSISFGYCKEFTIAPAPRSLNRRHI